MQHNTPIEHWPGALREGRAARKMRFRVNPTRSVMPTPPSARSPPTGTVTFLFTDIEGSTRLWDSQPAAMQAAVARHDEVMRRCIAAGDGHVFKTVGDAFCTAFPTAPKALAAALAAQQALHAEPWPDALPIRVRMALHTGAADERSGDYFGNPLNQVARLLAVAHGGQTLLSGITHDLCQDRLPIGSSLKALGAHTLADIARPEDIFQLCHPGLPTAFAPLRASVARAIVDATPSIAVLPFVNMSQDDENEYFADGLSEELMNVLSRVRGLRVPSRTSAFYFKGKDVDLATIAQKLGVATILEGSVRKSGKRVRITAQLIQVASDSHRWSKTYDRQLDDIFAVQDDIAQSVVKELRAALLPADSDASEGAAVEAEVHAARKGRSENAEAYRLYLQGRFLVERRTQADLSKGIAYLRQATGIDPEYALAWAALSDALLVEAAAWTQYAQGFEDARKAAERALALEPNLVEAHVVLGAIQGAYDRDWAGADASMRRALALAPENVGALLAAARGASNLGRHDEAIALARRAIAIDPLNVRGHRYVGIICHTAGLLTEAEEAFKEAIELGPKGGMAYFGLAMVYLEQGRAAEALAEIGNESHAAFHLLGEAVACHALGDNGRSTNALAQLSALSPPHLYLVAKAHAYRGEIDEAFAWLERAYAQRNSGLSEMKNEMLLRSLHADPRWHPFLRKMRLAG